MKVRTGVSLIELIVALTVFAVGLLGLAAVAAVAHRSFTAAAAVERGVDAAALIMDSLLHVHAPGNGARSIGGVHLRWLIEHDSTATAIRLTAGVPAVRDYTYHTVHSARAR